MSITVVLTHWKRTGNLRKIVKQLAQQTIAPKVFIWNNSRPLILPKVDWRLDSSFNTITWARWLMGSMADTEYLAIMDDDLIFSDTQVLEDATRFLTGKPERMVLGIEGIDVYDSSLAYGDCPRVRATKGVDHMADMILGRFMLLKTRAMRHVHLVPGQERKTLLADDIIISAQLAQGERHSHCVPGLFDGRVQELPAPHGSSSSSDHYRLRDQTRREFFLGEQFGGSATSPE